MRFSEAEWKIMRVVWRRPGASVRDVLEEVEAATGWSYSTVKTMLTRLAEKSALATEKRGNLFLYTAKVGEREARRSALRSLLDRAFDGTVGALVHHLLADERLSLRELAKLRSLIEAEAAKTDGERGEAEEP